MIVLDCSAAIEMARGTETGLALQKMLLVDEEVVSVDLLRYEVASVVRKMALRSEISLEQAAPLAEEIVGLVDRFFDAENLMGEALRESIRLGHSSYDLFYFVLARRMGATLLSTDDKFVRLCLDHGVNAVAKVSL